MRILVIGGAGYIGSHVVCAMLDAGHDIVVFDNLSSGSRDNLFTQASFREGDILDEAQLNSCLASGFDGLVHLAAFKAAGESMVKPSKYSKNNITGTINILNGAVQNNIKNIVFSSSAAVYGEPAYLPMDEKHPTVPENYYGHTKLVIEGLLEWYDKLCGIRFAALRYFNAAGYDPAGRVSSLEKNPANLLPIILEVASGQREQLEIFGDDYDTPDGTCIRDYVHVNDLAGGHVAALNYITTKDKSLTANLGSESGLSVLEMLKTARAVTGEPIPSVVAARRPGDPARVLASSEFAHDILGWQTQHSDVQSLVETTWRAYVNQAEKI